MLGGKAKGATPGSQTVTNKPIEIKGSRYRVDAENLKPGQRPASVHIHDNDNSNIKYFFNPQNNQLYILDKNTKAFIPAPNSAQKLLQKPEIRKAINRGMIKIGEEPAL